MAKAVSKNESPVVSNEDDGLNAEQKAFKKSQKEGYDPNRVENPHAKLPTEEEAKAIVKKYGDFSSKEVPNELVVARAVLKNSK